MGYQFYPTCNGQTEQAFKKISTSVDNQYFTTGDRPSSTTNNELFNSNIKKESSIILAFIEL